MKQPVYVGESLFSRNTMIRLRKFGVIDLGWKRSEAALVGHHLARQPHGHMGPSVEAARERDHRRSLGMATSNLDRIFHALGAGVQKQGLLWKIAGRERVEPLREPDIGLVGR